MAEPSADKAAAAGRPILRLNERVAGRYGSITVPPSALVLAMIGVGVLAQPDRYSAGSYQLAFRLCPSPVFGAIFAAVGVAALARPKRWTLAVLVEVHICWAFIVTVSTFTKPNVSPTAVAYPGAVAWVLFCSVAGMGHRTGYRLRRRPDRAL